MGTLYVAVKLRGGGLEAGMTGPLVCDMPEALRLKFAAVFGATFPGPKEVSERESVRFCKKNLFVN